MGGEQIPIPCARCGAPMREEAPASVLAPVTVRCAQCGASEELPADAADRVTRLRARLMQIRWQRGVEEGPALGLARTLEYWRTHALPVVVVGGGLVALVSAVPALDALALEGPARVVALVAALARPIGIVSILGGTTAGFLWSMGAFVHEMRPHVEARPPAEGGAPMRCRVCGGDLPAGGASGFVRCGYCSAENLVTPAIAAERAARLDAELREREARAAGTQARFRDAMARYQRRLYVSMGVGAGIGLVLSLGAAGLAGAVGWLVGP